jgi:predicted DNA binding CopG/RHH family protein
MSKKSKMNYGKKDVLTLDDLDMKKAKIRITTMIDANVYDALKLEARTHGIGYQTLINSILSKHCGVEKDPMDVIQDMINGLYERVDKRLDTIGHACMH